MIMISPFEILIKDKKKVITSCHCVVKDPFFLGHEPFVISKVEYERIQYKFYNVLDGRNLISAVSGTNLQREQGRPEYATKTLFSVQGD